MAKTVIKTSSPHRRGLDMVICGHPIKWDVEGHCEVSKEIAEELIERDPSVSLADPKTELKAEMTEEVVELAKGEIEVVEEEDDEINIGDEIDLKDLTKKGLQDVASEADLDRSEWGKLSKTKLIEYLEKHL